MATLAPNDPRSTSMGAPGRARWCAVQVETDRGVYVGNLYVPETRRRLSDVLCDDRPFLNLVQVSTDSSGRLEPYLAINKRWVRTVRVISEGAAPVTPLWPR